MKLALFTERVIKWNEARYDQVYNYDLAAKLLLEETEEMFEAKDDVETIDAIGDIIFVAAGVFWKLGFNAQQVEDVFHRADLCTINMLDAHFHARAVEYASFDIIDHAAEAAFPGVTLTCYSAFVVALGKLRAMGLQHEFYNIVHAICDSNDTKALPAGKVDASVKANVDKGKGFIPPTVALQAIIDRNYGVKKVTVN